MLDVELYLLIGAGVLLALHDDILRTEVVRDREACSRSITERSSVLTHYHGCIDGDQIGSDRNSGTAYDI